MKAKIECVYDTKREHYRLKLMMWYRSNGKPVNRRLDLGVGLESQKQFSEVTGTIVKEEFGNAELLLQAQMILDRINTAFAGDTYLKLKVGKISYERFSEYILYGAAVEKEYFIDFFERHYNKHANIDHRNNLISKISSVEQWIGRDLLLADINKRFLTRIMGRLKNDEYTSKSGEKYSGHSKKNFATALKTFYNLTVERGVNNPALFSGDEWKIVVGKEVKATVTPEHYKAALTLIDSKKSAEALLLWLLRFSLCGNDYKDIFYITHHQVISETDMIRPFEAIIEENVKRHKAGLELKPVYIKWIRNKTKERNQDERVINVGLPETLELINLWNSIKGNPESPYLIKVFPETTNEVERSLQVRRFLKSGNTKHKESLSYSSIFTKVNNSFTVDFTSRKNRSSYSQTARDARVMPHLVEQLQGHAEKSQQKRYSGWSWGTADQYDEAQAKVHERFNLPTLIKEWRFAASDYLELPEPLFI